MNLNDIAVFLRVAEAGSFTRAARTLGLPKTTVSRKVAGLETALGVRLIHRTTRSVSLTDAGNRYYRACSEGLARLEAASATMSGTTQVPSGTIRVSAPADFGNYFLADLVAEFLRQHERVRIELVLTDASLNLVEERIDLAFRTGRLPDSSLVARKLGPADRVLCASPRYLDAAGVPRRVADLRHHDCIVFGASLDNATWTIDGPGGARSVPVKGRIAVNVMAFAMRAAVAGLGIAHLPAALAARDIEAGRLKVVLPGFAAARGGVYAVYPSSRHVPAAVTAFVDFVAGRFNRKHAGPVAR